MPWKPREQILLRANGQDVKLISTLVANVADAYFQLRALDLQLEISKRTLNSRQESLRLTRILADGSSTTLPDVRQAAQLVFTASAEIPVLEHQIEQQENVLSILLAQNPGDIPRGQTLTEQHQPPDVPAGLPSALLIQTTPTQDDETRFLRRSNTSHVKNVSRVRHLMWVEVGTKVTRKNRARSHSLYPPGARQRPYMRNLTSSFAYSGPMQASSKSWRNNGCSASLLQALRAILPAAATSETEGLQAAGYFILPHDQRQQLPSLFLSFGSWE